MTEALEQAEAILKAAEEIVALKAIAGPGDLSTAQIKPNSEGEWVECPACYGEGMVDAETYVNFDDKPLTVQFYGIGECFGNYQNLFDTAIKHAPSIALALIEKHRALEEALELFRSICSAYENQDLNHVDFRVKCAEFARDFLTRQGATAPAASVSNQIAALKEKNDEA